MCTSIVWSKETNGQATLVARNMDWFAPMGTNLWVLPAGQARVGLSAGNALRWSSKYGSVVASSYDLMVADGMNEEGLTAHALWLSDSTFGPRDESLPGVSMALWAQYYLDNFKTVAEAVEATDANPFQVVPVFEVGRVSTMHLQISDATGDVAVIELLDGKTVITRGKKYPVLTNQPTFSEQLAHLKAFAGFGGKEQLPGTVSPEDRFVRASYYLKNLEHPRTYEQAVAYVLSVARNAAQPYVSQPASVGPDISPTIWRSISDSTNLLYMFESTSLPFLIWLNLNDLDFSEGAPVRKLLLKDQADKIGQVNAQLEDQDLFNFALPTGAQEEEGA